MHYLKRYFNNLAAGLGLGFGLLASTALSTASAVPLTPPGGAPSYMNSIYQRLIRTSTVTPPQERRIYSAVSGLTDTPDHPWLNTLKDRPEGEASREVSACLENYCEEKYADLSEQDKFIARIMVIEAMFDDGLDAREMRAYSQFVSTFQPLPALKAYEDQLMDSALAQIINHPVYESLQRNLLPANRITPQNAALQFQIRRDFIEHAATVLRRAHGMDKVQTILDTFPAALNTAGAYALNRSSYPEVETSRTLLFNYNSLDAHDISLLVNMIAHEVRHTVDFEIRDKSRTQKITPDDVYFRSTLVHNLNDNYYIPLCASSTHASRTCPEQHGWYRNQYIERSAQDYARLFTDKFNQKVRERNENAQRLFNDALLGAKPQPPHLPDPGPAKIAPYIESRRLEAEKFKLPQQFLLG